MLPKTERFSARDLSDKTLFNKSGKIYTQYGFFVILANPDPETKGKKGIILSKKNFKTAVLRNKYKRLFYNTVRELQQNSISLKSLSLTFHPKKAFSKEELKLDIVKSVI